MNPSRDKFARLRSHIYRFAEGWNKTELTAFVRQGSRAILDSELRCDMPPQQVWLYDCSQADMGTVCQAGVSTSKSPPVTPAKVTQHKKLANTPDSKKMDLDPGQGHKWVAGESCTGVEKGDALELNEGDRHFRHRN